MSDIACPLPITDYPNVLLAHGGGGRLMHEMLTRRVLPALGITDSGQTDAALQELGGARLAFTTDGYVVKPLFFPGGDIGRLAVSGTVNDLAMMGAVPHVLSLSLILEEGLPFETLDRVLASIRATADAAGVRIVTGDTKVVDRGKADGLFINTAGIGTVPAGLTLGPAQVREGDAILVSGDLGRHGIAVLAEREGIGFETVIESDVACLHRLVAKLLEAGIELHCLRDLTRGGLASAAVEIAQAGRLGITLEEAAIPVAAPVEAACELLGLDPLHVANEGRMVIFCPQAQAEAALDCLRADPLGAGAALVGRVHRDSPGRVALQTRIGSLRALDMLSGEQLPRIC
ncbi:hydrogenase expression/formation protein HypE [Niveibacterium sp. SC-1]|uniref:hydrogenase expression/formation protein HypE n=1 Tax=Niveibacterium sp. SC-1 TaxID=3135646 RepID=UPI00311DC673